jgi:excisionase family DNA binding protein
MKDPLVIHLTAAELRELVRDEVSAALAQSRPAPAPASVLNSDEAAQFLKMPVDTLRKRVRAGEVPSFKIGNLLRFRVADLEGYIDGLKQRKGAA